MFKKFLVFFAAMYVAMSFAAVDVNKATPADLDGLKGIGPGISGKIVEERKKGEFKNWNDFIERVKGIGEKNAVKFSAEGMTVSGASYKDVAPAAKKDAKPAAAKSDEKKDAKPATAASAPAAPSSAMTKDDKKSKADTKKAKADEKADAAKPAASAAKK